jgi:hypothetical protein
MTVEIYLCKIVEDLKGVLKVIVEILSKMLLKKNQK